MDARANNGPLIAAGGGFLLFISLFLTWFADVSGWAGFDFSDIVLALIGLFAVAVGASIATGNAFNVPGGAGPTLRTAGLIALGMIAALVFEGEERGFGMFLGLLSTIGIIYGAMQLGSGTAGTTEPRTKVAEPPPPPPPPPSASV